MVSKVVFIGDTQRGQQERNILHVQSMFSPVLKELNVPFSAYVTAENRLDDPAQWLPVWQESLASGQASTLDVDVFRDAAVIGFEAAEKDLALLSQHGVSWMNFSVHPLRFLDDLYLEVTTSFRYDFSRHAASNGLIDVCVQALRVRYGRQSERNDATTLAIFGQTPIDRSVYFDGGFRSLADYLGTLDALVGKYDHVLYKPHPYLSDPAVDALVISRYDAQPYTQEDTYKLFVRGNIDAACAVSSSVLVEAPYFGVRAEFLEPKAQRFGSPIGYRTLLDDLTLWETLLDRSSPVALQISRAVPPNYLRQVFSSWGFVTDAELLRRRIEKEVGKKVEQTLEKVEQILKKAEQTLEKAKQALEKAEQESDESAHALREVSSQLNVVYSSTSWRVTAPLRKIASLMLSGRQKMEARTKAVLKESSIMKSLIRKGIGFISVRPRLRAWLIALVARFPRLYWHLKSMVSQTAQPVLMTEKSEVSLDQQRAPGTAPDIDAILERIKIELSKRQP